MSFLIYKVWMVIESIIRFVIGIGQKLIGKEFSEMQIKELLQFVKFGIVGISNSVVNYSTYVTGILLLNRFFPLVKNGYVVAQTMGFVVSVFWAFCWNNRYVFHMGNQTKKEKLKALLKTYAAYSFTGLILSELLLYVWISIFEISVYVAPVINLIICLPINFWINKIWAFKN